MRLGLAVRGGRGHGTGVGDGRRTGLGLGDRVGLLDRLRDRGLVALGAERLGDRLVGRAAELAGRGQVLGAGLGLGHDVDGLGDVDLVGVVLVEVDLVLDLGGGGRVLVGHGAHPKTLMTALEMTQSTAHTIAVSTAVVTSTTAV